MAIFLFKISSFESRIFHLSERYVDSSKWIKEQLARTDVNIESVREKLPDEQGSSIPRDAGQIGVFRKLLQLT